MPMQRTVAVMAELADGRVGVVQSIRRPELTEPVYEVLIMEQDGYEFDLRSFRLVRRMREVAVEAYASEIKNLWRN